MADLKSSIQVAVGNSRADVKDDTRSITSYVNPNKHTKAALTKYERWLKVGSHIFLYIILAQRSSAVKGIVA
jgi:hypothetical protein